MTKEERLELVRGLPYSTKAGMYSFGCLLYVLIYFECDESPITLVVDKLITFVESGCL